jgi:hypothetical protein
MDLRTIFAPPTKLNLLAWSLLDTRVHLEGLEFLSAILAEHADGSILPMMRPFGGIDMLDRRYSGADECRGQLLVAGNDYSLIPIDGGRMGVVEIWLQVTDIEENRLWNRIGSWVDGHPKSFARRWLSDSEWNPFLGPADNCEYCKTEEEFYSKSHPDYIQGFIREFEIPWLTKLIWAQATRPILEFTRNNGVITLQNPNNNESSYKHLFEQILSPIDLRAVGFRSSSAINPRPLIASHMAAYAVDVITYNWPAESIQFAFNKRVLRPYVFPSDQAFFDIFKIG